MAVVLVESFDVVSALPEDVTRVFEKLISLKSLERGQTVPTLGLNGRQALFVVSGLVGITPRLASPLTGVAGPGQLVNPASFLDDVDDSINLFALMPTVIAQLPVESMRRMLSINEAWRRTATLEAEAIYKDRQKEIAKVLSRPDTMQLTHEARACPGNVQGRNAAIWFRPLDRSVWLQCAGCLLVEGYPCPNSGLPGGRRHLFYSEDDFSVTSTPAT